MKTVRNLFVVFSIMLLFAGCYTELATVERNDRDYAYDADTTYEDGSTTINNHYYLDDNYRRSRLRTSFHYYYPENTSWIGAYYNSYFNDPYWGMRPFSWSYDPWHGYYPTGGCYPYDPWYPHYPGVYYPVYYPAQIFVNSSPENIGKKHRADGPSHEGTAVVDRSRPISTSPSSGTTVAAFPKTRESEPVDKVTPVNSPKRTRDEVPWWEKKNSDQPREARPVEKPRTGRNPNVSDRRNKGNEEAVSTDRPREARRPAVSPSPKQSTPNNESRPVDRPRESRRQSYNPPPQSSPSSPSSSSSPSRGGGGSSSTSSGGRKRN